MDGQRSNPGSSRFQTACLPDGFTLEQIRRVVVKSLSEQPEKLHLGVARAVQEALAMAFPCKK